MNKHELHLTPNELKLIKKLVATEKELEELKRDVKRYFETRNKLKTILPSAKDITEFWELEEKLSKVGKENDFND